MVNDENKISKLIKEHSKGGITAGIALLFVYNANLQMKDQQIRIEEIKVNQREIMTTQKQIREEVSNLWVKYNDAMKGKESLSKEGSAAYLNLIERINRIERKID